MRQAILLLALITPSARACFDETRGGCFTAGFVDNLSSAEDCQAACAFDSACNYFAYHSARGDRRCHFCHDDRDVSQCAANVNNPSADARWRDCVWGPELCPGDIVDELTPQELLEDSVGVAARFCAGVLNDDRRPSTPASDGSLGPNIIYKLDGQSSFIAEATAQCAKAQKQRRNLRFGFAETGEENCTAAASDALARARVMRTASATWGT